MGRISLEPGGESTLNLDGGNQGTAGASMLGGGFIGCTTSTKP